MMTIANDIGGVRRAARSGACLADVEPATGQTLAMIPDSDAGDVADAVNAAREAFPGWAATPAAERSRVLLRIAELIDANAEELARLESTDTGKPIALAGSLDIPRASLNFRFFATAILHTRTDAHHTDATALNYTVRGPRGVVGLITPWNLPLYLLSWKVAPALATGNTAVAKPSELAPLSAARLGELCAEAGLPPGVLNLVHGQGSSAGAALVTHPAVGTISFTGGTVTGRSIATTVAGDFKKLTLEMGGKNPAIVFADADLDETVQGVVRAGFTNQGQICLCGSRVLVEDSMYDRFMKAFLPAVRSLRIGDPLDPATAIGAVVSEAHRTKIEQAVRTAQDEGGRIECGGGRPGSLPERCRHGYFVEPTLFADVESSMSIAQDEIFGPVGVVIPFEGEDEAVAIANDTKYGLAASVWHRKPARAYELAKRIRAGTITINGGGGGVSPWAPFGGYKHSGIGVEFGDYGMLEFTQLKTVGWAAGR